MIKALAKLAIEGNFLELMKGIYQNPITNIILNGERLNAVPLKKRQGCLIFSHLFNVVSEVLAKAIQQEKEIKGIQIRKEEVKLSQFADDMILYVENLQDYTQKTGKFSKVAAYKINKQKSILYVYIK